MSSLEFPDGREERCRCQRDELEEQDATHSEVGSVEHQRGKRQPQREGEGEVQKSS